MPNNDDSNNTTAELSERRKRFVEYYLQLGNATQAALKAGYSTKAANGQGSRLLANADIQAAIATRIQSLDKKRIADTNEILEYLTEVLRGEHEDEIVMNIGKGKGYTAAEKVKAAVGAKERLKAAEMLAKVNGMFLNRQEIEFSGNIPVVIKDDV